jgi:hypothetical protein
LGILFPKATYFESLGLQQAALFGRRLLKINGLEKCQNLKVFVVYPIKIIRGQI